MLHVNCLYSCACIENNGVAGSFNKKEELKSCCHALHNDISNNTAMNISSF